jgi:hypothetical protein
MGVDYRVWLLPTDRAFKPSAEQIAGLANGLRNGRLVPQPDAPGQKSSLLELLPGEDEGPLHKKPSRSEPFAAKPFEPSWVASHGDNEVVFEWWVNDAAESQVDFPFAFVPYPETGLTYFGIRVIVGDEYFYWTGETVMPFPESETQCRCGEQLAYWTGFASGVPSQRIHRECPKCRRAFDVCAIVGEIIHPWTGESRSVRGGMAFRFALQVDAHKNFPHNEELFRKYQIKEEIHELWMAHIAAPYETIDTAD